MSRLIVLLLKTFFLAQGLYKISFPVEDISSIEALMKSKILLHVAKVKILTGANISEVEMRSLKVAPFSFKRIQLL